MRALLIGALAATLVGCSCPLRPQVAMELCPEANGFACFDSTDRSLSIEPKPASFKTNSVSLKSRLLHASNAAADSETTRANVADSSPGEGVVANSNTATIQEQVVAATTVAERMTVATAALELNKDRSGYTETQLRSDADRTAPATPSNTDRLVAILMVRPEIKSVSDLTSKTIAIDDKHSASVRNVRTAIMAAGASDVELIGIPTKAINVLVHGAVPAAVLALVSPEAAEAFPEFQGFKVFRIPLSPQTLKSRP
ncbi:MAG: hypothetical protein WA615_28840 [Bradyrhizobium sp.]|uniref:hypothetical protein n=1 Tax=Bradyrhizobium sp. TaxID=376 RepID=UPI003C7A362A